MNACRLAALGTVGIAAALSLALVASGALAADLPDLVVPDGLGVNIHFTGAPARHLDMLRDGGFKFIRMDFVWSSVERERGKYDFKPYDELTSGLEQRGIRALYILDYSNKLYETERSVQTPEGRAAFARFAAAAAERYKGRRILWELWNEPNISFWQPQPSVEAYMALARETLPAVRKADPTATIVAPATSGIPLDFMDGCFERGLLDMVDAVTVHPYRQSAPETVLRDYLRLRALIAKHRPDTPMLPILSGEWGYSAAWHVYDRQRQGLYLPRELLTNLSAGVPVSIWYDWIDDGPDPKEPEHNFGTVTRAFEPKPAYLAMQKLAEALKGLEFVKRLGSDEPDAKDFSMLFAEGDRRTIAAWTIGEPHETQLWPGRAAGLSKTVEYHPVPPDAAPVLAEGAWTASQKSVGVRAGASRDAPLAPEFTVTVRNPWKRRVRVRLTADAPKGLEGEFDGRATFTLPVGRSRKVTWRGLCRSRDARELAVTVKADVAGHESRARVPFIVVNPVAVVLAPWRGGLVAFVDHERDERFDGELEATVGARTSRLKISRAGGRARALSADGDDRVIGEMTSAGRTAVRFGLSWDAGATARVRLIEKAETASDSGELKLRPLEVTEATAAAHDDGDRNVAAEFKIADAELGPDAPAARGLRFTYRYAPGWKFVRIAPRAALAVEGRPSAIGVWVRGDGSGNAIRMRFRDATGRTWQPHLGELDFKGWRFMSAPMDSVHVGHWGGTGDESKIAYPLAIDSFVLIDSTKAAVDSEVTFAGFSLLYAE